MNEINLPQLKGQIFVLIAKYKGNVVLSNPHPNQKFRKRQTWKTNNVIQIDLDHCQYKLC